MEDYTGQASYKKLMAKLEMIDPDDALRKKIISTIRMNKESDSDNNLIFRPRTNGALTLATVAVFAYRFASAFLRLLRSRPIRVKNYLVKNLK